MSAWMNVSEGTMPVVESAAAELVKTGVLGAALVLIGAYAFWVTREWNKTQAARVEDQQKVTSTLIDFSNSMKGTITDFSNSMKDVLRDLKTSIDALKTETAEERKALALIETVLTEVDRGVETNGKALDAAGRALDTIKTQGEDGRRAHETLQRAVDDVQRRSQNQR